MEERRKASGEEEEMEGWREGGSNAATMSNVGSVFKGTVAGKMDRVEERSWWKGKEEKEGEKDGRRQERRKNEEMTARKKRREREERKEAGVTKRKQERGEGRKGGNEGERKRGKRGN